MGMDRITYVAVRSRGHRLGSALTSRAINLQSMAGLVLPIHTERLLLRTHRPDDLDSLLDYYSDPEVARYIPWEPWSQAEAEAHLQKRSNVRGLTGPTPRWRS